MCSFWHKGITGERSRYITMDEHITKLRRQQRDAMAAMRYCRGQMELTIIYSTILTTRTHTRALMCLLCTQNTTINASCHHPK